MSGVCATEKSIESISLHCSNEVVTPPETHGEASKATSSPVWNHSTFVKQPQRDADKSLNLFKVQMFDCHLTASTRRTTSAKCGSLISNAYRIKFRVWRGIEELVMSRRARCLREASMMRECCFRSVDDCARRDALL